MNARSAVTGTFGWEGEITHREAKMKIAEKVAAKVKEGDVIGAGSGSSSYLALQAIGRRIHGEQLHVRVIPTSLEIGWVCSQLEIPQVTLNDSMPDWCFDGTDEIDNRRNLIKGRGGALFREKLLIKASPVTYILADKSKQVEILGSRFPVPIEVFPMAVPFVERAVMGFLPERLEIRKAEGKDGPLITENGNLLLDAWFNEIPPHLEHGLKSITGVIETGLFTGYKTIRVISD